jgi:hypothetical protein
MRVDSRGFDGSTIFVISSTNRGYLGVNRREIQRKREYSRGNREDRTPKMRDFLSLTDFLSR